MMYKIIYSRLAKKDMEEIIYYISHELKNKKAAIELKKEFENKEHIINTFPYGSSIYKPVKPLKYEYRRVAVKNFDIFYIINEKDKNIIIMRVLYDKRNVDELIK